MKVKKKVMKKIKDDSTRSTKCNRFKSNILIILFFSMLGLLWLYGTFLAKQIQNIDLNKFVFCAIATVTLILYLLSFGSIMKRDVFVFNFMSLLSTISLGLIFTILASTLVKSYFILYIILSIAFVIIYCLFCLKCDPSISKFSNIVSTAIISIFITLNTFVWKVVELYNPVKAVKVLGEYSKYESFELFLNIILFPIFAMTVISGLISGYREYKENKNINK